MRKLYICSLIALATVIVGLALAEEMTFTTYYPAPYGVYRDFEAKRNVYLATEKDVFGNALGKVGIGTTNPATQLEVQGGAIKATDGLIIHTVASQADEDALTPVIGQTWLRTDINP